MGCCPSHEERMSLLLDTELSIALKTATSINKLVLLGAGGSGKSTFFKQLRTIHGPGYSDKDRIPFKKHVFHQIIQEMKRMIRFAEEMSEEDPKYKLSDDTLELRAKIKQLRDNTPLSERIGDIINMLWKDQGIRNIFVERAQFAITDSTGFFLDEIQRISAQDYIPTYDDVLFCRHRSIGIVDKLFVIKDTQIRIFDVGGQNAERRKWIHCFEDVTAVIYVASLSGYNEVMYEDETGNVMQDSMNLFQKTCNNEWFNETSMILFLNKSDLYKEKIERVNITCCFPDYKGPHTHDASLVEIKKQFKARNQQERLIYSHITCAVDTKNVEAVFNDVQHLIVSVKMGDEGLM